MQLAKEVMPPRLVQRGDLCSVVEQVERAEARVVQLIVFSICVIGILQGIVVRGSW